MRVVLVVWGFERFGGMERHVVALALGLHRAGAEVSVVSEMPVARANVYARALRDAGVALSQPPRCVWIANAAQIALWRSPARTGRLIHGGGLLSGWLLRRLQRQAIGGIDLIHIHGCRLGQAWLLDWAKARAIPTVYTEHVTIADAGGPLIAQGTVQARNAGMLACVSEHSKASLAALFATPPPITVTGHIVGPCAAVSRSRSAGLELLCPARLEAHKGVDVLLRAFALIDAGPGDLRLTIAGSGRQEAELKRLAVALGITARTGFVGMLPPARMADALAQADMVVLPSRSEALPLALLEAMACAKPIIATAVGGIPELVDSGANGLLVPAGDVAALAAAIGQLVADPDLRARLGAHALATFAHSRHHECRVIPEMLDLYRLAAARC